MAQTRKSMPQHIHNGGYFKTISRTVPSKSSRRIVPDVRTKVPKSPAEIFLISAPKLTRLPQRVRNTTLMNSPNTDGIKKSPRIAALATTRHFTNAEIACEISASKSIHTTLPIKIALANQRFSPNQVNPSKYD